MKTLMATLAAVAAVTAAAPVAAQPYRDHDRYERDRGDRGGYERHRGDHGAHANFDRRRAQIDRRIERNLRDGDLTRREAVRLSQQLNDIQRLQNRYRQNGYNRWEISDLDRRLDNLERRVYAQIRDGQYAYRR